MILTGGLFVLSFRCVVAKDGRRVIISNCGHLVADLWFDTFEVIVVREDTYFQ